MNMDDWKEIEEYRIDESFKLEKANHETFSIYYEIYGSLNKTSFVTPTWNTTLSDSALDRMKKCWYTHRNFLFWIVIDGIKVGGAFIRPNHLKGLFTISPYEEQNILIDNVVKVLKKISDTKKAIVAEFLDLEQNQYLKDIGFSVYQQTHYMLRPTEKLDTNWNYDYKLEKATYDRLEEFVAIQKEHFDVDLEEIREDLEICLKDYVDDEAISGATLSISLPDTNEVIGFTFIYLAKDIPEILYLSIKEKYRRKGLAENIIKHQISSLSRKYPLVKLRTSPKNPALKLYKKLGFKEGTMFEIMKLKPIQKKEES